MTSLEIAMDKARMAQIHKGNEYPFLQILTPENTSEGIAAIFEDNPLSKPVAITTVAFARKFCAEDPYYTWRKL